MVKDIMLNIDLYGNNFSHLRTPDGIYSMTDNRKPLFIKWTTGGSEVSIFIDNEILNDTLIDSVESKYKIAMIVESIEISPNLYKLDSKTIAKFDFILTYSDELVRSHKKYVKYPFGGSWIKEDNIGIHNKTHQVNMLYSNKSRTTGHRLRHEIAKKITNIDLAGSGCSRPFDTKEEVLCPYRYSIVVENTKMDGYFSEKLLDCFAVGTIPIYWGCQNVGNYFDDAGIISFDTIEELQDIVSNLSEEDYFARFEAIKNNLNKVKDFYCQEDWLYRNIFYHFNLHEKYQMSNCDPHHPLAFIEGKPQSHWLNLFFRSGGNNLLYDFDLSSNSVVFDLGTYKYEYANNIIKKYGSKVHTFEPVSSFYNTYSHRNESINNNAALSKLSGVFKISLNGDASSESLDGQVCRKIGFEDYIKKHNIDNIDLMKINIEGGEYELLKYLLSSKRIKMVDNILIQFHPLENSGAHIRELMVKQLERTHQRRKVYFPFVWEHWKRKSDNTGD